MMCEFNLEGIKYQAVLQHPVSIAIPLKPNNSNPNCFFAPPLKSFPVKDGDWVGAIEKGGSVNFYNIHINPHGNGTHTECFSHIKKADTTINQVLDEPICTAFLTTIEPELLENGDMALDANAAKIIEKCPKANALIIRTSPNDESKKTRNYSGTNPPYITQRCMQMIVEKGFQHLLIDLPSVDRAQDGGKLVAHKTFWIQNDRIETKKTITELIFVHDNIKDGIYLLNIGICALEMDVSPSRPILYAAIKL